MTTKAEAGRKGGLTVRNERGSDFYRAIGKKGGAALKAKHGPEHFKEIGAKGGARVRALIEAAKAAEADVLKEGK